VSGTGFRGFVDRGEPVFVNVYRSPFSRGEIYASFGSRERAERAYRPMYRVICRPKARWSRVPEGGR
jgi:hypothetical protein